MTPQEAISAGIGSFRDINLPPLRYQSGDIPFTEWISILTLSLAPLIAHIVAGAPRPAYLEHKRPEWHERISHFNPTTILWRYAAMADRRIRSRVWEPTDMAAANAMFWTSHGWDGSEAMAKDSLANCTRLPEKARIRLASREMVSTVITTFQGLQALISLVSTLTRSMNNTQPDEVGFTVLLAVDSIFFPLAVLGLMRLSCAIWLTDEFTYVATGAGAANLSATSPSIGQQDDLTRGISQSTTGSHPKAMDDLGSQLELGQSDEFYETSGRLRKSSSWPSRLFRAAFLVPVLAMWVVDFLFIVPTGGPFVATVTSILTGAFYIVLLTATLLTCGFYLIKGNTSTVLPCIGSRWYKVYTGLLGFLALGLIIVSCIESRRAACGKYTSAPRAWGDGMACATSRLAAIDISPNLNNSFGIASTFRDESGSYEKLTTGEFWVYNFTGTCLGVVQDNVTTRAVTIGAEMLSVD